MRTYLRNVDILYPIRTRTNSLTYLLMIWLRPCNVLQHLSASSCHTLLALPTSIVIFRHFTEHVRTSLPCGWNAGRLQMESCWNPSNTVRHNQRILQKKLSYPCHVPYIGSYIQYVHYYIEILRLVCNTTLAHTYIVIISKMYVLQWYFYLTLALVAL